MDQEPKEEEEKNLNIDLPELVPNFTRDMSDQLFQTHKNKLIPPEQQSTIQKIDSEKMIQEYKFFKELEEKDSGSFIYEHTQNYVSEQIYKIPSYDSNQLFTFPSNPIEFSQQVSINEKYLNNKKTNIITNEQKTENPLNNINLINVLKMQKIKSIDSTFNRIESALNVPKTNLEDKYLKNKGYIKLSHFGNLLYLLTNLFTQQKIKDINTFLNKEEVNILIGIIKRKYHKHINENLKGYRLVSVLEEIVKNTKEKRPEEKYKFVFKKSLKYLKKKIRVQYDKKKPKIKFMDYFYNYYFLEVSKKQNLSIDHFHHPKRGNKINKTINANYIKLIKKSNIFLKDFFTFTNNFLVSKYKKNIKKKFQKTISAWDKDYKNKSDKEKYIKHVLANIKGNKKFKIPWSIIEVESAMKAVDKLFNNDR